MTKIVILDAGPLGKVSHPKPHITIVNWLKQLLANSNVRIYIPEIADYEIRRELIRANKTKGINRLNQLKQVLGYIPITTAAILKAAELWAEARNKGYPTAHDKALDGDVILAGQVETFNINGAVKVIATENVGHLSRFTNADVWNNIL
jgi:predicted nucleic acid-binding protein